MNQGQWLDTLRAKGLPLELTRTSLGALDLGASDSVFQALFEKLWGATATVGLTRAPDGTLLASFPEVRVPGLEEGFTELAISSAPCTLSASFSAAGDGQVHAVLSFELPEATTSKQLFPSLPAPGPTASQGPLLHGERLTKLQLIVSTHEAPPLRAGLNLRASWTPTRVTPAQGAELELLGPIVLPDPLRPAPPLTGEAVPWSPEDGQPLAPGLHLRAALIKPHPLWGKGGFTEPAFIFYSPLTKGFVLKSWGYQPRMAYLGNVSLGTLSSGKQARGSAALCAPTWEAFDLDVLLVCSFQGATLGGVEDVLTLGKGLLSPKEESLKFEALPAQVTVDERNAPELERALLRLVRGDKSAETPFKPTCVGFTIGLGTAATWNLVEGEISVGLTKVGVTIANDAAGLRAWGSLTGQLTMWRATFEASVELPGPVIRARQVGAIQVTLAELLSQKANSGLPGFQGSELVIKDMSLSVTPAFKPVTYRLSLRIQGALSKSSEEALPFLQLNLSNDEWALVGSAAGEGGGLKLGELLNDLLKKVARHPDDNGLPESLTLPEALQSFRLTGFTLSARTQRAAGSGKGNRYTFACEGTLDVGGKTLQAGVRIELSKQQSKVGGWLSIGNRLFSFTVETSKGPEASKQLAAAYSQRGEDRAGLGELLQEVIPLSDEVTQGLDSLQVNLKSAFFASTQRAGQSKKVLGVDIGAAFDFGKLPLVGKGLSSAIKGGVSLDKLQLVYAAQDFSQSEVESLNGLLPSEVTRLPVAPRAQPGATAAVLHKGLTIAATLNLGGSPRALAFPTTAGLAGASPVGPSAPSFSDATTTDSATWLTLQKAVGPVYFERVGVEYQGSKLRILVGASLTVGGLTISLDGLSLGAPISPFELTKIEPGLRGLGIDYRNDAVEIGGAFLRVPSDPPEYTGAAILKARGLTLSAFGSYTDLKDDPSFFIYAVLDYPLGGPSFLYVTGLAAGFGYNRALKVPPIEGLARFSLIQAAMAPAGMMGRPAPSTDGAPSVPLGLTRLKDDVRATEGEHFVAAGIHFTSFKLIDSFVLLTVSFGKRCEIHLLGLSRARIPAAELSAPDMPPIANVGLALAGSFLPSQGILELRAQLTPGSYLFDQRCHLTGGFAFKAWFDEGDFVLTLGGYHPRFSPGRYPLVPRLGFAWQVTPQLLLKGDSYFALTPSALMAGGHLEASWTSESVRAWFKAGIDFLIAWKPYHYAASAYVDIGVEVTFELFGTQHLTLDLGADLSIWGPEFSGRATIHLWIISITVEWNSGAPSARPLQWEEFKDSFLPPTKQGETRPEVCTLTVTEGLTRKSADDASNPQRLGVLSAGRLALTTRSLLPASKAFYKTSGQKDEPLTVKAAKFGIQSMGLPADKVSVSHTLTVSKRSGDGKTYEPVGELFCYEPVPQQVPSALWGQATQPGVPKLPTLGDKQLVDEALTGFIVRPKPIPPGDRTSAIERSKLITAPGQPVTFTWQKDSPFPLSADDAGKRKDTLEKELGAASSQTRNALLRSLGFKLDELRLDDAKYDFLAPPQIEVLS